MKRLVALFLSVSCSFSLMGQNSPAAASQSVESFDAVNFNSTANTFFPTQIPKVDLPGNTVVNEYFASTQQYTSIKGSPYWHKDNDVRATLVLNDETMISDVGIKYDVYANQVISVDEDETQSVLDKRMFKKMIIEEGESMYTFKKVNPDQPDKFYQVLYESPEHTLIKDVDIRYSSSSTHAPGQTIEYKKFVSSDKYYFVQNNVVKKVNLKKKDFFENFSEAEKFSMLEYIKKNKIKLKKEKDFVKVLATLKV